MLPGYHTAGLLQHDLVVAMESLAQLGFRSVAIRPRSGMLDWTSSQFGRDLLRVADAVTRTGLDLIVDFEPHFVEDPWHCHGPSLASRDEAEAERARKSIEAWLVYAEELRASLLTFGSGAAPQEFEPVESVLERLGNQLNPIVARSEECGIQVALRPQHGAAISTVAKFERLLQWLHSDQLLLAADIGEMLRGHELPLADRLARHLDTLACVYLCDRKTGHPHDVPLGQGDVAHDRILRGLTKQQFSGPVIARVEGHSELGFSPAAEAIQIFGPSD